MSAAWLSVFHQGRRQGGDAILTKECRRSRGSSGHGLIRQMFFDPLPDELSHRSLRP
jgi:hypothetical protein